MTREVQNGKAKRPLNMEALTRTMTNLGGARVEKKKKGLGEVVGGTAAECAAVCCCFPCMLMNLLVLAVVKVPVRICKKAKKRQRLLRSKEIKKRALLDPPSNFGSREGLEREIKDFVERGNKVDGRESNNSNNINDDENVVDLEKEMWDRFYASGFWRSPSRKGTCLLD